MAPALTSACWISSPFLLSCCCLPAVSLCLTLNILFHFHGPSFRLPPTTPGEHPLLLPGEAFLCYGLEPGQHVEVIALSAK